MSINKNYKLSGERNFALGRVSMLYSNLSNLYHSKLLTETEKNKLSCSLLFIEDVLKESKEQWEIFRQENNFKSKKELKLEEKNENI